jgi:hypothetical protein
MIDIREHAPTRSRFLVLALHGTSGVMRAIAFNQILMEVA